MKIVSHPLVILNPYDFLCWNMEHILVTNNISQHSLSLYRKALFSVVDVLQNFCSSPWLNDNENTVTMQKIPSIVKKLISFTQNIIPYFFSF